MQRPVLPFLLTLFVATLASPRAGHAQTPPANDPPEVLQGRDATASDLVRQISVNLDKCRSEAYQKSPKTLYGSWEVTYQPQYNLIEVQRDKEVLIRDEPVPNENVGKHNPTLGHPNFSFRVEPFVSPAEYARFKVENETIQKQLSQIYGQMLLHRIPHKFDSFLPKNEKQKKEVDAYNELKKSLHSLPDFYFRNISLSWLSVDGHLTDGFGEDPPFVATTTEKTRWQRERSDITQAVLQLLSRYEPKAK